MLTTWGMLHLTGTIPRKVNIYTPASFHRVSWLVRQLVSSFCDSGLTGLTGVLKEALGSRSAQTGRSSSRPSRRPSRRLECQIGGQVG